MRRTKFKLMLIALTALTLLAGYASSRSSHAAAVVDDLVNPHYKGGSIFNLAGAAPNVARCGAFPENVELSFTGGGIDTEGGLNTAVFSACANTVTNEVRDLKAIDTYTATGDQVFIEGEPFVQAVNLANCTASTSHGVNFRVTGGTGAYAGATGGGRFNLFSNLTPCNGQVVPAHVSFEGWIKKVQ
jgi:hypothetical protein